MVQNLTCSLTREVNTGADIAAQRFVVIDGSGLIAEAGLGTDAIGISGFAFTKSDYDAGSGGSAIGVVTNPGCQVEVEASAAIATGAAVSSAAGGKARVAGTGHAIMGRALTAAAADGDIIEILFSPAGRFAV